MKLRIHHPSRATNENGEIHLTLIQVGEDIMLAVVDQDGRGIKDPDSDRHGSVLLTVTRDGYVAISPALMPSLGFKLDAQGRVALDPYCEAMAARFAQNYGGKRAAFREIDGDENDG